MKWTKYIIAVLLFIIMMGVSWYVGFKYNFKKQHVTEHKSALMERIEKVFKLIAVEGHISEIYSYKDYYYYDISPFRKKALIRVNAKVSVGYDFESVKIDIDETEKLIYIGSIPEAEILSLDHELEYYDLDEGTFNNFSGDELTKLNESAKKYAHEKAKESDLFDQAEEQKADVLDMIKYFAESQGYSIEIATEANLFVN